MQSDDSVANGYQAFLAGKRPVMLDAGIVVDPATLHPAMKGHQRAITAWAIRKGRAAVWADTGLGKALIALEWARQLMIAGLVPRVLIFAPLSVAQQFVREGEKWGIPATYARSEAEAPASGVVTTNYERLASFDLTRWDAVVCDESSIVKSDDGETKKALFAALAHVRFRLACTATPAPNDIDELGNHAELLGVMSQTEMRAAFFVHDDEGWRLKGHAHDALYQWLATWAIACKLPSDLGYSDDGYLLPPLSIIPEIVDVEWAPEGQLFLTKLKGVQDRAAVRRDTVAGRIERTAALVANEPGEQWLLWYGLLDEAARLEKAIPGLVVLRGSDTVERKADVLTAFSQGQIPALATHARIAGFGMNFQSCARMAFVGLSDSYEVYYQAIRRCWRFGQEREVHAHIVLTEPERAVYENVLRKEREAGALTSALVAAMRDYERAELNGVKSGRDPYEPTLPLTIPAWLTANQEHQA